MKKIILIFILSFVVKLSIAQNKKEQIIILQNRIDSIKTVYENEILNKKNLSSNIDSITKSILNEYKLIKDLEELNKSLKSKININNKMYDSFISLIQKEEKEIIKFENKLKDLKSKEVLSNEDSEYDNFRNTEVEFNSNFNSQPYNSKEIEQFISSANSNESKSRDNISIYKEFLSRLNSSEIESISMAKNRFLKQFEKDDKMSEEGFRLFRNYYINFIEKLNEPGNNFLDDFFSAPQFYDVIEGTFKNPLAGFDKLSKSDKDIVKMKYSKSLNEITRCLKSGIKISGNDVDGYRYTEDFSFLADILQNYEFDLVNFFELMKSEDKEIHIDAALKISWEELRKKIIRYEKFVNDYPNLKETKQIVEPQLKWFFDVYIGGLDNTPTFDWDRNVLNSELKNSYKIFLIENKKSKFFLFLQKYYNTLEKNKFKRIK